MNKLPNSLPSRFEKKNIGITFALLMLSFSTVVYTLVIFKLLSFFIMPSLFFDLLFIGFPIGALLGSFFLPLSLKSFIRAIWILQLALIFSTFAVLFAHNFSYLKVHLFDIEVSQLMANISVFTALFLPFFIAYGLSEYIGYQIGREQFKTKMHAVYAIFLFAAAAAYFLTHWLIPQVGVVNIILGTFLFTALIGLVISRGRVQLMFVFQMIVICLCYFLPNLESNFLRLYKGSTPLSTSFFEAKGFRVSFQEWGKYSLNEILASPDTSAYYGFYNDFLQWEYYPERGYHKPSLGTIPLLLTDADSKKLIIGSGGGRQVRFASVTGHKNITAVEIEPAVINAVRDTDHLLDEFQYVYDREGVQIIQSEGRKYLERLQAKQDLIYLPSVGGYPQMMLEPGNLIRTYEAYKIVLDKLSKNGLFAIWYPAGLDSKGILTDQYVSTFRDLNMAVKAYRNDEEFLILSTPDPKAELPPAGELLNLMALQYAETGGSVHSFPIPLIPIEYVVAENPNFQPVTDDKPYLGGNLSHIFSTRQIYQLYGSGGLALLVLGMLMYFILRRKGDPKIPGRTFNWVAVLSFFLGANFLLVEHHMVLLLFKTNYVFHDALVLGAVFFLIFSGIGSVIVATGLRRVITLVAVVCYLTLTVAGGWLPSWLTMGLIIPGAVATGTFFPVLFEKASKNPLGVFALDAIGAGVGSLLAAAIPILFGFQVYGYVVLIIFLCTISVDHWFHYSHSLPLPVTGEGEEPIIMVEK